MIEDGSPSEILRALVAIPSASHGSNVPMITWIQRHLAPLGWHARVQSYRDQAGVEKQNLIVSPQSPGEGTYAVELALVCHTDTVPAAPGWAEPTRLHARDGHLYGLGACDVKGFLACLLAACPQVDVGRCSKPFCLVFTADEEVGCKGARFLAESGTLRARYAIVGEPTSLVPARAGKGYCLASVTVHGRAAHSAYPGSGASAIMAAARLITRIEIMAEHLRSQRDEAFSPPYTTVNVGLIQGGTAKNVVAEVCSFVVEWRPVPSQPSGVVAERLRELAADVEQSFGTAVRIELDVLRQDAGFATPEESAAVRVLLNRGARAAQTIAFGTEAPWLARMGADAVVFGPGSMLTAHSARECVPEAELLQCTAMLVNAIQKLCA